MRVKITVEYDGTSYCGWQRQINGISVQQVIEEAIYKVTGENVKITGSGRTDAGVHAKGQVAHFDTEGSIPAEKFSFALNTVLPPDIKVKKSEAVSCDFNARKSAKKKTYSYTVYYDETPSPLKERYAYRMAERPDINKMRSAAKLICGKHDFKSFCASKSGAKTTVRTVYSIKIINSADKTVFKICGNGFLYNMVRIIVGTLIKIGLDKMTEKELADMLSEKNRSLGGKTLPANGLCLECVVYGK